MPVSWGALGMAGLLLTACASPAPSETTGTRSVEDAARLFDVELPAVLAIPDGFFTLRREGDRVSLMFLALGGEAPERLVEWDDPAEQSEAFGQIVVCGDRWSFERPVFVAGRWRGGEPVRLAGAEAVGGRLGSDEFLFALTSAEVPTGFESWSVLVPDEGLLRGADTAIVMGDGRAFERVRQMVVASGECAAG